MAAIDPEVIKIEIEQNRQELNRLGECLGALHPEVLGKSQQLDRLILEYMINQSK